MPELEKALQEYRIQELEKRDQQLEKRLEAVEGLLRELLTEMRASKKAGRWFMASAMAVGGFITWLIKTFSIHIGGSVQ